MLNENLGKILVLLFCFTIFLKGIAISADESCDIMPGEPHIIRIQDFSKPANAVAGKLWWHSQKKMYIREIILYNNTSDEMITKEIYEYVMSLKPTKCTGQEDYGYRLWPDGEEKFDFKKFK